MNDLTAFELTVAKERRRDLQYYRWAVVGLVLLNCLLYGAWLTDKMGWM